MQLFKIVLRRRSVTLSLMLLLEWACPTLQGGTTFPLM